MQATHQLSAAPCHFQLINTLQLQTAEKRRLFSSEATYQIGDYKGCSPYHLQLISALRTADCREEDCMLSCVTTYQHMKET